MRRETPVPLLLVVSGAANRRAAAAKSRVASKPLPRAHHANALGKSVGLAQALTRLHVSLGPGRGALDAAGHKVHGHLCPFCVRALHMLVAGLEEVDVPPQERVHAGLVLESPPTLTSPCRIIRPKMNTRLPPGRPTSETMTP